jgi:hypothetical protein
MRDERLEVSVTFDERRGYIATAPELRSPVTALSLGGLRRRLEALRRALRVAWSPCVTAPRIVTRAAAPPCTDLGSGNRFGASVRAAPCASVRNGALMGLPPAARTGMAASGCRSPHWRGPGGRKRSAKEKGRRSHPPREFNDCGIFE